MTKYLAIAASILTLSVSSAANADKCEEVAELPAALVGLPCQGIVQTDKELTLQAAAHYGVDPHHIATGDAVVSVFFYLLDKQEERQKK